MNLSKLEKTVIMVLVIAIIIGLGAWLFAWPAYEEIGKAENKLEKLEKERKEIYAELEREATIDDEIKDAKAEAEKLEGSFYPDLTTYETVEVAIAHLKDSGLETHAVSASNFSTYKLALEVYKKSDVVYNLKTYSQKAREKDEDDVLLAGQFNDNGKVYTVTVNSLTDVVITDENDEKVEISKYTDTMAQAHKEALCAFAVKGGEAQTVGLATATFDVTGRYEDYLNFINYVFDFERATHMSTVVIPMTTDPVEDDEELYIDEEGNIMTGAEAAKEGDFGVICDDDTPIEASITLMFLCVEQMEEMEELKIGDTTIVVNQ